MKSIVFLVLLSCTFVVHGFEWQKEWDLWKDEYGKKYDCDEMELSRRSIWAANKVFVDTHNANAKLHGYTVKLNEFADLVSTRGIESLSVCRLLQLCLIWRALLFDVSFQILM